MPAMTLALTAMSIKGLASAYGTNRLIDNEISAKQKHVVALRKKGMELRDQFNKKASQAQLFGDYEHTRIDRIQKFKTSEKKVSIAGRGAALESGTPYNLILSQQADNTANLDMHSYKVMTETNNLKNEGQRQYDSLHLQAQGIQDDIHKTHKQRNERVITSLLTGGMSGFSQGMDMANAYNTAYPGTT